MSYIFFLTCNIHNNVRTYRMMNTRKVSKFITNMKHKKVVNIIKKKNVFAFLLLCYFILGYGWTNNFSMGTFLSEVHYWNNYSNKYIVTRWINAFISFLLLTFMLINKFHLHIDLGNYLISLIK